MNLFHFFNEVYKGDKRFKPITWMVKAPWFIDHKDNRNFQIKLRDYTKGKQLIDLESLLRFFSLWGEIDKKKLLNCEDRVKKEKVQWVELIDAKDLIAVLNDKYNSWEEGFYFDIKLWRDKISIRGTDWLKLFYDETTKKYTFRDFSEKWRFWILGFLWNYYFEFNKWEFREWKKFLTKFFKENFNIVLADNEINYFARFCRNELSRDYTNTKWKKLIPLLPLQRFLQKKWFFQDGRKAGIEELKKYLKIFDLRRVDSDLAIRYSKDDFINLVGEIWGRFDEVSNSIENKENSLFGIEIFNKQKSDTNILLIQYKKNKDEYLLDLSCNWILYKKNTQLLISENVYNYIMSLRSLDKIIFLFDILIGFQINEALTYNITHSGFTNKKYIYQVLKESWILEDVPAYTIQWDYLFVWNKHWIEKIKNKT